MTAVSYDIDTLLHVIEEVQDKSIGNLSDYTTREHPGTNKKIEAWKWDQRTWPDQKELDATSNVPTLWDPESDIPDRFWQSGIGDGKDLILLGIHNITASGQEKALNSWEPKLNHGFYYIHDEEWYLYSDWYQTEVFAKANTISGMNYVDMQYDYKRAVPIKVRDFLFDHETGRYKVDTEFRKKVEFTESGTDPEFIVDTTYSPPRIWLNDDYVTQVGSPITLVSGVADADTVTSLELVDVANGTANQEYYLLRSPVDRWSDLEVWTYSDATSPRQWTVLSGLDVFVGSGAQVYVDYDLGIIRFGDYDIDAATGAGEIPQVNQRIAVHYYQSLAATYEPIDSRDYVKARNANTNPLYSPSNTGFISLSTKSEDPYLISLTSDMTKLSTNLFETQMGNTGGKLIATVYTQAGTELEGVEVNFEILDPTTGSFGGSATNVTAITNQNGQGTTFYSAPSTIDSMGGVTGNITTSGDLTYMTISGLADPGTVSGVYTYRIHEYDLVLGIEDTELATYYTNFLSDELIVSGNVATQSWEETHRGIHNLFEPVTWTSPDIRTGAKSVVLTTREAMHPHTGEITSVYAPVYPISIEDQSTSTVPKVLLTYSGITFPVPGAVSPVDEDNEGTKGYMVVGESRTNVRAWVQNTRTNRRIYSNVVTLHIAIPNTANGTYFADTLNQIPSGLLTSHRDIDQVSDADIISYSGQVASEFAQSYVASGESYVDWFRRTYKGDSVLMGLTSVTPSGAPAEIPLGWRLKSTGITIASILDQITYLDPNDTLISGYFTASGHYKTP
jgi:hypothetical protein